MARQLKKLQASDHENYTNLSVIGFVLPLIGMIIGIVYVAKDGRLDRKLGEHLIAISVLGFVLWAIVWQVAVSTEAVNSFQQLHF
jgi:hypothetical protein